ncbi:MAG TPA: hypothetical protein VHH88_04380 [Verrucomicrobiae bacterium]|nr:hypothetical protein [Verrucomicrobiae bacterium]
MKTCNPPRIARVITIGSVAAALVLFNPRAATAQGTNEAAHADSSLKKFFEFDGGDPIDFIRALDHHFRTRLIQILSLPDILRGAPVPKLRVAADDPKEVLKIYNGLDNPELGQWRFEADAAPGSTNLGVLALVPDKSIATARVERNATRVQALPLAGIPTNQWSKMTESIEQSITLASRLPATRGLELRGRFQIQPDARILILAGPQIYLDAVESIVSAYRSNAEIGTTRSTPQTEPAP